MHTRLPRGPFFPLFNTKYPDLGPFLVRLVLRALLCTPPHLSHSILRNHCWFSVVCCFSVCSLLRREPSFGFAGGRGLASFWLLFYINFRLRFLIDFWLILAPFLELFFMIFHVFLHHIFEHVFRMKFHQVLLNFRIAQSSENLVLLQ